MSRLVVAAQLASAVLALVSCGSTSQEITGPGATKCAIALSASSTDFGSGGGAAQLTIGTQRECRWQATSEASWIVLSGGAEGQGPATIEFSVGKTDDPVARSAAVRVEDMRLQISQRAAPCGYRLSLTQATVPASGAGGDVDITASSALCEWTARSESEWLTIKVGASGRGNGRVTFEASATAGPPRTGRLIVADQPVTVTQSDGCQYAVSLSTPAVAAGGGGGSATVTTSSECPWSATTDASWLSISSGTNGTGTGSVHFTAVANAGPARSAVLMVAGRAMNINQASGCTFTVTPGTTSFGSGGGASSIAITTGSACPWSANAGASWLSITSGANGSGTGSVQFSAAANSGPARSTSLTVADRAFTINQASGCTFNISPTDASFAAAGGTASITVTAASACPWSAVSQSDWLTVASGSAGSGSGVVNIVAAPSVYEARTGTVQIATRTFSASQARGCVVELSATSASFGPEGGTGAFEVRTHCPWRTLVEGGATWVVLTRGDRANGTGPVWFTVAPNDGPPRSTTLLVEDHHRFTIYQSGR